MFSFFFFKYCHLIQPQFICLIFHHKTVDQSSWVYIFSSMSASSLCFVFFISFPTAWKRMRDVCLLHQSSPLSCWDLSPRQDVVYLFIYLYLYIYLQKLKDFCTPSRLPKKKCIFSMMGSVALHQGPAHKCLINCCCSTKTMFQNRAPFYFYFG